MMDVSGHFIASLLQCQRYWDQERLELSLPPLFTMYKNLSEEPLEALLYKYIPLGPLHGGNDAAALLCPSMFVSLPPL